MQQHQLNQINKKKILHISFHSRIINKNIDSNGEYIFSYTLAYIAYSIPSQLQHDLMNLKQKRNKHKGHNIFELITEISHIFKVPPFMKIGLTGVGHLQHAITNFAPIDFKIFP